MHRPTGRSCRRENCRASSQERGSQCSRYPRAQDPKSGFANTRGPLGLVGIPRVCLSRRVQRGITDRGSPTRPNAGRNHRAILVAVLSQLITGWHLTRSLQEAQKPFHIGLPVALLLPARDGPAVSIGGERDVSRQSKNGGPTGLPPITETVLNLDFSSARNTAATCLPVFANSCPGWRGGKAGLRETLDAWKPSGENL